MQKSPSLPHQFAGLPEKKLIMELKKASRTLPRFRSLARSWSPMWRCVQLGHSKKHVKQWSPCAAAEFLNALSSSNSIFLSLIFAISQVFVCFSTVIGV